MKRSRKPEPVARKGEPRFGYGDSRKKRRPKMQTIESTRTVNISQSNLDSSIAQFLYSMGALQDSEDVSSIKIGTQLQGIIPLTIKLKKH